MTIITIPVPYFPTNGTPVVIAPPKSVLQKAYGYDNVGVITSDDVVDRSTITGQPVFMPLQFDPVTYLDENGSKVSLNGLYIPLVICKFHLHKYVHKTIPSGRRKRGIVAELTNPGAWDITIEGCFLNEDNVFPVTALKQLAQYMACTESIGVTHEIFKALGIEYMCIEDADVKPRKGFQNMLFFEIKGFEDTAPAVQLNLDNPTS